MYFAFVFAVESNRACSLTFSGFNTGSALTLSAPNKDEIVSLVAVNTTLAAASACISAMTANYVFEDRKVGEGTFSLSHAMNGCLSGLVAATGGCAVIEPWAAVVTGFVAGILYLVSSQTLIHMRIDDAVDAVPVHMANGVFGSLATGLFASGRRMALAYPHANDVGIFMGGNGTLLACQCCGVLFVVGWVTTLMFPFFMFLNYLGWLRASASDEVEGLDISYHVPSSRYLGTDAEEEAEGPPEHVPRSSFQSPMETFMHGYSKSRVTTESPMETFMHGYSKSRVTTATSTSSVTQDP